VRKGGGGFGFGERISVKEKGRYGKGREREKLENARRREPEIPGERPVLRRGQKGK